MKEVINIRNGYNESDEMIIQDADVYSFVGSDVFTATGGYQVVQTFFIRDRDQKQFEARNREGRAPQKMVLLERNPNKPTWSALKGFVKHKEWIDLGQKFEEKGMSLDDIRLLLADEGFKIIKDGREKES